MFQWGLFAFFSRPNNRKRRGWGKAEERNIDKAISLVRVCEESGREGKRGRERIDFPMIDRHLQLIDSHYSDLRDERGQFLSFSLLPLWRWRTIPIDRWSCKLTKWQSLLLSPPFLRLIVSTWRNLKTSVNRKRSSSTFIIIDRRRQLVINNERKGSLTSSKPCIAHDSSSAHTSSSSSSSSSSSCNAKGKNALTHQINDIQIPDRFSLISRISCVSKQE